MQQRLQAGLREVERELSDAALGEALRVIGSPHFAALTDEHIREVSEYRPISIAGERFFEPAWSRSKEAAATLGFARLLGAERVRRDLERLRSAVHGSARPEPSSG